MRYDRLDALRGLAIVWMALFHFNFDLSALGYTTQNFYVDPFWTLQRSAIVTLFLACAGCGQAVAQAQGQDAPRFWRRWAQVAGCALLVSLGSRWMFPQSWISFGVLHGIALMLLLLRLGAHWPAAAWWILGAAALALPGLAAHPLFDSRWTNWVGLVTHKPATEDYVPLLPWLGVMAWGLAVGRLCLRRAPGLLAGPLPHLLRPLATLGRWSLSFYMLHQPVLIGGLMAWKHLH